MGKPTPIGDLLADYEANGFDFTDLAWVRAAARGYVKTMPDSQVRCLLHVLAQTTAEAQAQGGGEVVAWVSRHDAMFSDAGNWRYTNPVLCSSQESPDLIPLYTAPPSAPVGVERPLSVFSAGEWRYSETGHTFSAKDLDEAAFVVYRDHLAQQPAADEEAAEQYRKGWEAGHAAAQQPAAHPDDAAVDAFAAAMKEKLAAARAKGRGGWNGDEPGMRQRLSDMLRAHVEKGDPRDVANFAMFLHQRGEAILPSQQPAAVDALAGLDNIAGYFQDGSEETLLVTPDDATRTWHVYVGKQHLGYGKSIRAALTAALAAQPGGSDNVR